MYEANGVEMSQVSVKAFEFHSLNIYQFNTLIYVYMLFLTLTHYKNQFLESKCSFKGYLL